MHEQDGGAKLHIALFSDYNKSPRSRREYLLIKTSFLVDGAGLQDLLCFWTATNMLPPRSQMLIVSFDKEGSMVLPMAECCFLSLVLPVKHANFEDLTRNMDVALKYGMSGFTFS